MPDQVLFLVPAFRDGILAAEPAPRAERSPILAEVQATFAFLREGLARSYDPLPLVTASEALPLTFAATQQNDAAEFLALLSDNLEEALRGSRHASLLRSCFGGTLVQQVVWEEPPPTPGGAPVRKVSEREQSFLQIELDLKGHRSIEESFRALVDGERLEGDNAYELDSGGKVAAVKRLCLGELPPTLVIQLKRFEFDYEKMVNVKLNSECSFPMRLDCSPFTRRGLECAARGEPLPPSPPYELAGVVVHAGSSGGGHYFSYACPRDGPTAGKWFAFNDTKVTRFDEARLPEQCYGGGAAAAARTAAERASASQSGFLLLYRRVESSRHRRIGSAPPVGIGAAGWRGAPAAATRPPAAAPADGPTSQTGEAGREAARGVSSMLLRAGSEGVVLRPAGSEAVVPRSPPTPSKFSMLQRAFLDSGADGGSGSAKGREGEEGAGGVAAGSAQARAQAGGGPPAGEGRAPLATTRVRAANEALLRREHLLDRGYAAFVRALLTLPPPTSAAPLPPPPPLAPLSAPTQPAAAESESASALRTRLLEFGARYAFSHLLRLNDARLEPVLAGLDGWLATLARACGAQPAAAAAVLHYVVAPQAAVGGSGAAGRGVAAPPSSPLLDAVLCSGSAAGRSAVADLVVSLARVAHGAEAVEPRLGAEGEPRRGGHMAAFFDALLRHGVCRAVHSWRDAAPFWELLRGLLSSGGPPLTRLAEERRGQEASRNLLETCPEPPCRMAAEKRGIPLLCAFLVGAGPIREGGVLRKAGAAPESVPAAADAADGKATGACGPKGGIGDAAGNASADAEAFGLPEALRSLTLPLPERGSPPPPATAAAPPAAPAAAPSAAPSATAAAAAPSSAAAADGAAVPAAATVRRSATALAPRLDSCRAPKDGSASLLECLALLVEAHHPPPPPPAAPASRHAPAAASAAAAPAAAPPAAPTDVSGTAAPLPADAAACLTCAPFLRAAASACAGTPAAPEPLGAPLDALARAVRPLCDERTVGEAAVDTSLRVARERVPIRPNQHSACVKEGAWL